MANIKRKKWIDLARALVILLVVLCHATESVYTLSVDYISSISMQSKIFAFTSFTLGKLGVPLFLMISGYLLLDRDYSSDTVKKLWKNNWLHLLICTWIWFAIYELFCHYYLKVNNDIWSIIEDLLFLRPINISTAHTWYMPMILGMYILIPFVAILLKSIDKNLLKFPIYISIYFMLL